MQRARSGDAGGLRRDIAAAAHASSRDHHLLWLGSLVCARLGVGHRKRLPGRMPNGEFPAPRSRKMHREPFTPSQRWRNAGSWSPPLATIRPRTTVCTD
eukprot:scaffold56435_cov65-Phaeocystis_antarctica.AAC.4